MITKIEGRELKTKTRVKGWAGWAPVSEAEKAKLQELVLCPRSGHGEAAPRETDFENLVSLLEITACAHWIAGHPTEVFCD